MLAMLAGVARPAAAQTTATGDASGGTVTHQQGGATTTATGDASGGTLTHTEAGATTTAKADASGVNARREVDCSKDPANEICKSTTTASADAGGLGFTHSQTSVVRVRTPGNGYAQIYGEAGALYGEGTGLTMMGGQGSLGVQGAFGGRLPGAEGGGWSGLGYRLNAGGGAISVETEAVIQPIPGAPTPPSSSTTTAASYQAGGAAGYQFLTFGRLDPSTLKQSGFGLFLGGSVGVFGQESGDPTFSYGPAFVISLPKYNAGTSRMSSLFISGLVLPLEDLFLATVNLGFAFGVGGEGTPSGPSPGQAPRPSSNLPPNQLPPMDF